MMALLSPKAWGALVLAAILAFSLFFARQSGKASVRAEWNVEKIAQQQASAAAESENRRMEAARQSKVIEAQNAQAKRTQVLQVAAAGARAESDGLRDDLARNTANLPGASVDACRRYGATANAVLGEMAAEGGGLAEAAGSHASDSLMYQEAWPK